MKENVYPENGSVVIIDDEIKEALPLMNVLSKANIPFKYFSGDKLNLPEECIGNIKILFLDLRLDPTLDPENESHHTAIISKIKGIIKIVVSEKCKPYIIIAWTKHQGLVTKLWESLKKDLEKRSPLFILPIDKSKCKVNGSDEFDIQKVSKQLDEKIKKFGSFKFFLKWQNISNKSSGEIINAISSIYPFDDNWDNNTNKLLVKLAEAYSGKQVDNENVWKYAMLSFNSLFLDIIESDIFTDNLDTDKNIDLPQQPDLDDNNIVGEINRRLHISLESNDKPLPGNIYCSIENMGVDKENLIENILNGNLNQSQERENLIEESELIHLEVSPFCDYAQNKWKRSRILSGIKWPGKYESKLKKADYIYKTPLFRIDNNLYYFVFDIRLLTSIELEKLNNVESTIRIRKELLNDIQTKIAGHINRLGITSL